MASRSPLRRLADQVVLTGMRPPLLPALLAQRTGRDTVDLAGKRVLLTGASSGIGQVGQKFAREIFFRGDTYDAAAAHRMGMVNAVVPHAGLERTALEWAVKINGKSPTAQRMLKYAFNAIDDGLVGQQVFAGEATRLAYMTDEAAEGRDAFLEKRDPDWSSFPWHY